MRHVAFTTRTLLASTVLVSSLAVTGIALADRGTSHDAVSAPPVLVEVPVCWGTPSTGTALASPGGAMVQTVTVRIEPTSLLRLDPDGHVKAAETNTGCAPRATDHVYVVMRNGDLVENTKVDVSTVRWTGDFTQFGFIEQQHD